MLAGLMRHMPPLKATRMEGNNLQRQCLRKICQRHASHKGLERLPKTSRAISLPDKTG